MKKSMKALMLAAASFFAVNGWGAYAAEPADTLQLEYKLHGQTRRFRCVFLPDGNGGVTLEWGIERNLKWWSGSYHMTPEAMERGDSMSFVMPEDGNHITLAPAETFAAVSREALRRLRSEGRFVYDGVEYTAGGENRVCELGALLHVVDSQEGCEMWILDSEECPVVWEMRGNPLEINWRTRRL
ncbi:MAG: hypothetical protein K2L62_03775 [Muribaculaceae bacterium]|nr:hypothetical protein [Muribaculaceae bacterium]